MTFIQITDQMFWSVILFLLNHKYAFAQQRNEPHQQCPAFGWGTWQLIETGNPAVVAHSCTWRGDTVLALHNFTETPQQITFTLTERQAVRLVDLLGNQHCRPDDDDQAYHLDLAGYGWFRVE